MSEIQIMTESMNLDSSDLVGSLEAFESLETIQAELEERFTRDKVNLIEEATDVTMGSEEEVEVKIEIKTEEEVEGRGLRIIQARREDNDEELEEEEEQDELDDDVMDMEEMITGDVITETTKMEDINEDSEGGIFSDSVIGEEIITADEQIIEDGGIEDDLVGEGFVVEEDCGVVNEKSLMEEGQEVSQEETVISDDKQQKMSLSGQETDIVGLGGTVMTSGAGGASSNVYVVPSTHTFLNAQSILQPINQKDSSSKMTRVVIPSDQTIRILAPQGKIIGSKTITLTQATQMGLIAATNKLQMEGNQLGKVVMPKKTVTVVKSPTKILPAPPVTSSPTMVQQPKTKVLIRPATSIKPGRIVTSSTGGQLIRIPSNSPTVGNIHQIHLPGKQVQYVKLVGGSGKPGTTTLVPVSTLNKIPLALSTSILNSTSSPNTGAGYKVLPVPSQTQQPPPLQPKPQSAPTQGVLIPASQTSGQQGINNFVMVSPQFLQQVKKVTTTQAPKVAAAPPSPLRNSTNGRKPLTPSVKIKEEDFETKEDVDDLLNTLEANGIRPRKPCNCTKSMCLKLYCDCFANGEFCNQCNCTCCHNNLENEEERQKAIKTCLERNPTAFKPKIGKSFSEERRHNRGCNCRRSGCLKNYCECYEAKIPCSKNCKCVGCKNVEGSLIRRLDGDERGGISTGGVTSHLPRLNSETSNETTLTNRQAFHLLTTEVVEATCQCLLAQAEDWEKDGESLEKGQANVIEEFGRCIVQIIDCISKTSPQQVPLVSNT